jgi:hypothetical protein
MPSLDIICDTAARMAQHGQAITDGQVSTGGKHSQQSNDGTT